MAFASSGVMQLRRSSVGWGPHTVASMGDRCEPPSAAPRQSAERVHVGSRLPSLHPPAQRVLAPSKQHRSPRRQSAPVRHSRLTLSPADPGHFVPRATH